MNAQALPTDIIYKIACDALHTRVVDKSDFKEGLKILAVCPEWRRVVMPVVYRNAYISTGLKEKIKEDNYDLIHDLIEKLSTVKVDTNVDLIQSQNHVKFVRKLNIDARFSDSLSIRLVKIASVLSTASEIWQNVHTLHIRMFKEKYTSKYGNIGSYFLDISDIASRFTRLMPSVRHLILQGSSTNSIAPVFYGYIAGAYNNQLEKLTSENSIVVLPSRTFTNIRHVDFNFNNMTNYPPLSINSCVLESLKMTNVFGTKYWDSFRACEQSNIIEFSNLKKLHVSQCQLDTLVEDAHYVYKLHFPCLQELVIDSRTAVLPWLYTAVLPAAINNIVINAKHELFTIPESFAFPIVENLSLNVDLDCETNRDKLLLTVSRILACTNQFSNADLSFPGYTLIINPHDINCGNITKLCNDGPLTIHNFYAFFATLPRLVEIKCRQLTTNEYSECSFYSELNPLPDANDMPLNICTKTVEMQFSNPETIVYIMADIVNHMLLKLPNLTKLLAVDVPQNGVIRFINAWKHNYPHLSTVHLDLDTTNGEKYEGLYDHFTDWAAENGPY